MSTHVEPLAYATDRAAATTRARAFHVLLLPALWLPAGAASTRFYGDEYGVYVVTNYPAGLLLFLTGVLDQIVQLPTPQWMWIGVTAGFALMAAMGWAMDRLRVHRGVYFLLPFLLGLVIVALHAGQFDPQRMPRAPWMRSDHYVGEVGSIAAAWSCYVLAAGSIVVALGARGVRRLRAKPEAPRGIM